MSWIVLVTADDSAEEAFGPFRSYDTASRAAEQLRKRSRRYTGNEEMADFSVSAMSLQRWPGIQAAMET